MAPSVSREVLMEEGDASASVGWLGVVGSPLLCVGAFQFVVASPWTPRQEVSCKITAPIFLPPWFFYFGGCPFVRVIVGNVGNGPLNGSYGGNYKPGGGVIR